MKKKIFRKVHPRFVIVFVLILIGIIALVSFVIISNQDDSKKYNPPIKKGWSQREGEFIYLYDTEVGFRIKVPSNLENSIIEDVSDVESESGSLEYCGTNDMSVYDSECLRTEGFGIYMNNDTEFLNNLYYKLESNKDTFYNVDLNYSDDIAFYKLEEVNKTDVVLLRDKIAIYYFINNNLNNSEENYSFYKNTIEEIISSAEFN